MSRATPEVSGPTQPIAASPGLASVPRTPAVESARNAFILRALLVVSISSLAVALSPFGLRGALAAAFGAAVALGILLAENLLRATPATSLVGGAVGAVIGALFALLISLVVSGTAVPDPAKSFIETAALLGFGYLGVMIGARASSLKLDGLQRIVRARAASSAPDAAGKLLDTSVLIDGRIAEICEAHFLDGPLLVPQFVLHELQMIADSADTLRRQRGRRGLDVLERIQKIGHLEVRVITDNPGASGEVDRKLVELAQRLGAKIVTNDFNLNKVASVQGISILNINLLANALRPAVLPGEGMRVFILREGKEVNQGVAYLEDGTMVVVDGARRLINKTVDILVTSVHQTPAGKMIFGRLDDRNEAAPPLKQAAAAGRAARPAFPESED
jgi:uncharacterized protein YacL